MARMPLCPSFAGLNSSGSREREDSAIAWSVQARKPFLRPATMSVAVWRSAVLQYWSVSPAFGLIASCSAAESAGLQKYLIFAILSCVPDRQRTLRELEVGRTLIKDGDKCGE